MHRVSLILLFSPFVFVFILQHIILATQYDDGGAANAAVSSQLGDIATQLSFLEKALTDTRHKLEL